MQLETVDYSTIGEILLKGISEANQFFKLLKLPHSFKTNISELPEGAYEVYMAKKDSGKPKDDYSAFDLPSKVKDANVKQNRFSVTFNKDAIEDAKQATYAIEKSDASLQSASSTTNSTIQHQSARNTVESYE